MRKRIEILVYVAASFLVVYLWVQQSSLLFDRKEKLIWVSPVALGRHGVNLWILSVPFMIGAFSKSLGSLRITSDFWNNMVIQRQSWFPASQKSSAELMIIWPDFTWRNTTFLTTLPFPSMSPLPWWASS